MHLEVIAANTLTFPLKNSRPSRSCHKLYRRRPHVFLYVIRMRQYGTCDVNGEKLEEKKKGEERDRVIKNVDKKKKSTVRARYYYNSGTGSV